MLLHFSMAYPQNDDEKIYWRLTSIQLFFKCFLQFSPFLTRLKEKHIFWWKTIMQGEIYKHFVGFCNIFRDRVQQSSWYQKRDWCYFCLNFFANASRAYRHLLQKVARVSRPWKLSRGSPYPRRLQLQALCPRRLAHPLNPPHGFAVSAQKLAASPFLRRRLIYSFRISRGGYHPRDRRWVFRPLSQPSNKIKQNYFFITNIIKI